MKYILFFLLFPLFAFAQCFTTSSTYVLSSGSSEGYERPRVVITANNSPFVIWSTPSAPKAIIARKWNGIAFDSAFNLVNTELLPTGFIGPEIAAQGDTVYLIFESLIHSNHVIYLKRSFDGGLSFSDTIRVSENSNTNYFFMPNIAIKEDGNPVISYMQCLADFTDYKQIVRTSFDFGHTFSPVSDVSALAPGEPCDCCQSTLVTSGSGVFLLFRNDDSDVRNTYVAQSTDDGLTFTITQDLDDIDWELSSCPTSSPVGAVIGDSIMVVRRNGGSGINELYKSNVNKFDFQKSYFTQLQSTGSSLQDHPKITTNLSYLVSVWEENRNGIIESFYNVMANNGESLCNGVISDTSTFGHKLKPDITFGGPYSGTFSVVYSASNAKEVHFVYASLVGLTTIHEASDSNEKKLLKSVDLIGKEVIPESNKPFINIYNDGSVERKIVVE